MRRLKPATTHRNVIASFSSRLTDPEVIKLLQTKDHPIWYQYFDHVIRNEKDYFKHLNYILQNPVKHGLTNKMFSYKWSNIHNLIAENGREWMIDCFRQYPVINFQPEGITD